MYLKFWPDFRRLQLDIVGFLAILGEGSVGATSDVTTLSWLCLLPRLLPAPQAMLRPSRPSVLEPSIGKAVGVYSGNYREHVNYVGHLVQRGEDLKKYQVQSIHITKTEGIDDISAKFIGWGNALAVLGCVSSATLLILGAVKYRDGFSIIATLLLSFLSTLIGIGNKWQLKTVKRGSPANDPNVPAGDVVVKYPNGSFLVIKCNDNVARELYFAPEEIDYFLTDPRQFITLSLVGTLMLMFGVVMLANAKLPMQIASGIAYVVLNIAYWVVAAIDRQSLWDLTAFRRDVHKDTKLDMDDKGISNHKNFTEALWAAIQITKRTEWIMWGFIAPQNRGWQRWIEMAQSEIDHPGEVPWEPSKALIACLNKKDTF